MVVLSYNIRRIITFRTVVLSASMHRLQKHCVGLHAYHPTWMRGGGTVQMAEAQGSLKGVVVLEDTGTAASEGGGQT